MPDLVELLERDLPRRPRRRRGRGGFGLVARLYANHASTLPMARPSAPQPSAFFSAVHSSRCMSGGGFGTGFASGTFAIGSSTTIGCGIVHIVMISPFARDGDGQPREHEAVAPRVRRQEHEWELEGA